MLRVFEIAMIQAKITYNSYGWHDPEGCFFVLKEDLNHHGGLEAYINKTGKQKIKTEPLVIRANAGDCIELHITNLLPEHSGNNTSTMQDEVLVERFFADGEQRIMPLHNYFFINSHQQHGMYGALIIEEEGATFHNPHNGKELRSGTQAVIRRKNGTSFREFILFVHDSAVLSGKNGCLITPQPATGYNCHLGTRGINYRVEPVTERLEKEKDPAYIFSSFVHGDPATPVLETYPGDELIIHLLDSTHTRTHFLNIPGMPVHVDGFSLSVTEKYSAGDYLYYLEGIGYAWHCVWGIIRVYGKYKENLMPFYGEKEQVFPEPVSPDTGSIINHYEAAAVHTGMIYNKYGNHSSGRLVFVLMEDLDMVLAGKSEPEPLVLYANDGEWIEITLHNALDTRISLNPQCLQYDPLHNSGINVGYNEWEQTVAPGESRRYLWYAGKGYGACILQSFGDIGNGRYYGLAGVITKEN